LDVTGEQAEVTKSGNHLAFRRYSIPRVSLTFDASFSAPFASEQAKNVLAQSNPMQL
jgi:hypothetical protein